VWGVAFNHDGTRLASASADGRVCLWNIETHKSECQDMEMDTAEVRSGVFSLDGRRLALVGVDRTVHLWEVPWEGQTGQRLRPPLTGNNAVTYSVAFNHNGTYLATASADNKVRLWETKVDVVDFKGWQRRACNIINRNLTAHEWKKYIGQNTPRARTCLDPLLEYE